MDLQEIYKALRSEYNGKTWSDEFMRIHVTLKDDQVICWFDLDRDDEGFEEKRDCAISFYDEVVRFLVDSFGEEFKYEDPRISSDYIDRNNMYGQYDIVLDDDGENAPVIAIWEDEENTMKGKIAKEAGRKVIPAANGCSIHDMYDCWIVTNKNGLNIGQCRTLIEAKHIAENADEYTAKKLGYSESRKLVKEGAGAGYDVKINGLKLGGILEKKLVKGKQAYDDYYVCQVEILPCECEIGAEDYYNDFFWQEHEFGETPTAKIDGGVATIEYSTNSYDEEEAEDELRREISHRELDISFSYSWGWTHSDLPREDMEFTDVDVNEKAFYGSITKLELIAPDLADAVNSGYASIFDRDEEEEEDEEQVNEVSGWKLEDEDLTLVNSESDGDKLYIVKLWWGSGYMTDNYNAYAFNEEEALNYVVAYIEKTDPESLETIDENANDYLQELVDEGEAASLEEAYEHPYFQETYLWVDATTEGAEQGHYIYNENLQIAEYPAKHNHPLAKGVDKSKFTESVQDVFTLEVNYIDEDGEPQMIEAMKYAKTYYSYEGALNAAKEAYQEYSKICEEPVEVWIMGGEYETPEGDIYGDPDVIEVVSADTIASL